MEGFKFNNIHSGFFSGFIVNKIHRPFSAPRTVIMQKVPNRRGSYFQEIEEDVIVIKMDVTFIGDNQGAYNTLLDDIKNWLLINESAQLNFDKEPTKFYDAIFGNSLSDLEEMANFGEGTIFFIIPDGDKYSSESTIPIADSYIFNNPGTKETFPTFKATMTADATFLSIVTKNDYIMIGEPATVEQSQVPKEQVILDDNMASITGWTNPNIVVDGGTVTGTMASDGFVFHASDYGLGDTWHGPVLAKGLSEPLQDFILETTINLACVSEAEIGRVELYLLDINNVIIGKIAMKDSTGGSELNMPEFFLRNGATNTPILVRTAQDNWQDFYGMLRLKREGQNFQAYLSHMDLDTGQHTVSRSTSFLDTNNEFQAKLASVAIHIAGYGTYATPNKNRVHHLTVKKINSIADMQVPFVAAAGDVIEFDHAKALILKNGEPFMSEKDFASNFFALGKGETEIKVHPQGVANVEMIYRPRWL